MRRQVSGHKRQCQIDLAKQRWRDEGWAGFDKQRRLGACGAWRCPGPMRHCYLAKGKSASQGAVRFSKILPRKIRSFFEYGICCAVMGSAKASFTMLRSL